MLKLWNLPLVLLVSVCGASCTQIVGLSDYAVSDQELDSSMESPSTIADTESDPDATDDAGLDATTRDADSRAPDAEPHAPTQGNDAALGGSDSSQVLVSVMEGDAASVEIDAGPICAAPSRVCGDKCVANGVATSCGSSCTPCSAPPNATPICSAGSCDFTCNTGHHRCGNECARDDSVSQCGGSCQVCPQIAHGVPQCAAGTCTTLCDGGGSLVNGVCKPRLAAKQLAVGSDHNCAIMADNTLRCWGSNQDHLTQLKHQLGPVPTANFSRTPVQVTGLSNVTQVTAGLAHTCALAAGSVVCWGDNQTWQLGPNGGGVGSSASPVTIPISNVVQIEAGDWQTCALLSDGTVTCWGSRNGGPLVASHGPSDVTEISFSGSNTCERQSGGGARCFGSNGYGAIGVSPDVMPNAVTPVAVPGLSGVTDITQGTYNGCAVTSANGGRVSCWGTYAAVGPHQVGTSAAPPAEIPGVANARGVASGYTSTCAWTSSGSVYCWGSNAACKLGQPSSVEETRTPTLVANLSDVVELGIGNHHVCARTSDGWVKCWGQATYGEVGPTTTSNLSQVPLTVPF
jgi:alpha-tubulin suppressor-like RCC1 family protein